MHGSGRGGEKRTVQDNTSLAAYSTKKIKQQIHEIATVRERRQ
jgi:hypothetical protein